MEAGAYAGKVTTGLGAAVDLYLLQKQNSSVNPLELDSALRKNCRYCQEHIFWLPLTFISTLPPFLIFGRLTKLAVQGAQVTAFFIGAVTSVLEDMWSQLARL